MKKVTLKDIAKELNVSVGTVSHALNGIPDISEETKIKVFKAAREMGYIINGAAASLRSGKTNIVAIIVPDISNPHIAYQIKMIDEKMREKNYSVIILNTNEDEEIEMKAIMTAMGKQVDGIMLCPCQKTRTNVDFIRKKGIPFVLIGRYFEKIKTDYVCADDLMGGYIAGRYLLAKGYRKPIYVGTYSYIEGSKKRFLGISRAFKDAEIPFSRKRYIHIDPMGENIDAIMEEVEKVKPFDSVIAFSDLIAFKIMSRLQDKSVYVMGFDAVTNRLELPYSFASVGMKGHGWADKAIEILMRKINGKTRIFQEIVDVKLYE